MSFNRVDYCGDDKVFIDLPGKVFESVKKISIWDEDNNREKIFVEQNEALYKSIMKRIDSRAILMSTAKEHTYMRAVGTHELERILQKELGIDKGEN